MTKEIEIQLIRFIDHFQATAAKEMVDKAALHFQFVLCTMYKY